MTVTVYPSASTSFPPVVVTTRRSPAVGGSAEQVTVNVVCAVAPEATAMVRGLLPATAQLAATSPSWTW